MYEPSVTAIHDLSLIASAIQLLVHTHNKYPISMFASTLRGLPASSWVLGFEWRQPNVLFVTSPLLSFFTVQILPISVSTCPPSALSPLVRSVAANIGSAIDSDLHEKPLHRIGSIWCRNHVESNLYVFFSVQFFFGFHSESILCPFKITAADITWRYVI
jgi:hypothetical protein